MTTLLENDSQQKPPTPASPHGSNTENVSPYDTPLSGGLRFSVEVVAWTAGPWAAKKMTDSTWAAVLTLILLMALPAIFNTPGDKKFTGIPTPGPVRIVIEMILLVAAVAGAWVVWPRGVALGTTILGIAMPLAGLRRYQWLLAGAPQVGEGN